MRRLHETAIIYRLAPPRGIVSLFEASEPPVSERPRPFTAHTTMAHWQRERRPGRTNRIVVGLIVTLSLAMVPLAFWMVKQELIQRAGQGLALEAADIADQLDALLNERLADIQTFAASPLLQESDPARIAAYLQDLKRIHPVYAHLSVAGPDGRIMARTDPSDGGHHTVANEAWFERVAGRPRPDIQVIVPHQTSQTGLVAMRFAASIEGPGGGLAGVIWSEVDQRTLRTGVLHTLRRSQVSFLHPVLEHFRIIDGTGLVLLGSDSRSDEPDPMRGAVHAARQALTRWNMGYVDDVDGDSGPTMLVGYAMMRGLAEAEATRWTVLVGEDRRTVLESTWNILWTLLGIGSAALLPLLGLLLWTRRRQAADERQVTAARQALEANDARIRTILDHALDAVISIDGTGVVTEWNPQAEQTFGFTKDEALGAPLHRLIIPEAHREAHRRGLSAYMHSGRQAILNRRIEITAIHKGGHEFPVELTVIPLRLGETVSFCAFLRDITEEKRAQRELKDSKTFLGSIVDHLPTMVFVKDARDLRFVRVNRAAEDLLGLPEAELVGLNDYDLFPKEQADFFTGIDRVVLESGQLQDTPEEPIQTKHKGVRILHTKKLPILDGQGRPEYLLGISEDITEHKQAEDALRRSQHAAEAANRAKTEFLANVSHEIRTPLNAALGMLDLLSDAAATPEQREYAQVGRRAGRVLLQLVTDLLDMAKVEAGTLQLYPQAFNVREFLIKTQSMLRPRAHEKGLHLDLMVYEEVPTHVEGDTTRIQQILLNLMGNAIKFTGQGRITLTVSLMPAQGSGSCLLRFAVSDTGIGIHPEQHARIFDRFTQLESGDNRKYGGTGLGLPISRQLAQLMGGTLRVESRLGEGSTFIFLMPCRPAAPVDAPSAPASDSPLPCNGQTNASSGAPLHILAVDDFPETLQLVKAYLKDRPYHLDLASCGEEAIERHRTDRYHLILMDMQMPHMDGYAVTGVLRAWEQAQGRTPVPVIAMTADVSDSARTRSAASGCMGFLGKPFTQAMLVEAIERYADSRQDGGRGGLPAALTAVPAVGLDPDLGHLRQAFIENRRKDLPLLSTALMQSDFQTVRVIGHRIKGLAGSYGLQDLGAVGASLEEAAEQGDGEAVGRHIDRLEERLTHLDQPEPAV